MKLFCSTSVLLVALAGVQEIHAAGDGTFFTYFDRGGLGPDRWANLVIDDNQCAGTNLVSGYGQSPVAIPDIMETCDTNTKRDYMFESGDCTWDNLAYSISNNGVKVEPKKTPFGRPLCKLGGMKIPHYPLDTYTAMQFHIHTHSEHTIADQHYDAEFHAVHFNGDGNAAAVWGTMLTVGAENPVFENLIRGWEKVAAETAGQCSGVQHSDSAEVTETTSITEEPTSVITKETFDISEVTETTFTEEPAAVTTEETSDISSEATPEEDDGPIVEDASASSNSSVAEAVPAGVTEETTNIVAEAVPGEEDAISEIMAEDSGFNRNLAEAENQPHFQGLFRNKCKALLHDPPPYLSETPISGAILDIYRHLHNINDADGFPEYGTYTYKGGLTTPPCTEIVNWNLVDKPVELSVTQMRRLLNLIDCYQNADTCNYETVAGLLNVNERIGLLTESTTSRPPQDLQGRTITHRCPDGPNKTMPDKSPKKPIKDQFTKPVPPEENLNTRYSNCEKSWTEECPTDPRADPTASPNLRVNAPVWSDFAGLWQGTYRAVDRDGNAILERFASAVPYDIPYSQQHAKVFKNVTIHETRYFEHTYFVFPPASPDFCSLPVPNGAANALGNDKCGENGLIVYAERFGTATHEKDGTVNIVATTGRFAGTVGDGVPVGADHVYFQNANEGVSFSETFSFIDQEKVRISGTGEKNIFEDYAPYDEDPLAEVFTYQLSQSDANTWIAAFETAQEKANTKKRYRVPLSGDCIEECPDVEAAMEAADPLNSVSPYETEIRASDGFIAGMVILAVLVWAGIGGILHMHAIKNQANRYKHQFARRIAETIKIKGSHTQLTPEALKEEFNQIDTNKDGMLSRSELKKFVDSGKLGVMSESDFNALFTAMDIDCTGEVDFVEFCGFLANSGAVYDEEERLLTPEEREKEIPGVGANPTLQSGDSNEVCA